MIAVGSIYILIILNMLYVLITYNCTSTEYERLLLYTRFSSFENLDN